MKTRIRPQAPDKDAVARKPEPRPVDDGGETPAAGDEVRSVVRALKAHLNFDLGSGKTASREGDSE